MKRKCSSYSWLLLKFCWWALFVYRAYLSSIMTGKILSGERTNKWKNTRLFGILSQVFLNLRQSNGLVYPKGNYLVPLKVCQVCQVCLRMKIRLNIFRLISKSGMNFDNTLDNLYWKHHRSQILVGNKLLLSSVILFHFCAGILITFSFKKWKRFFGEKWLILKMDLH